MEPEGHVSANRFVGRRQPLAKLEQMLDGSEQRRAALIQGPAGIGKTRLVSELLSQPRARRYRFVQACCYERAEAGPFFALSQLLSQLGAPAVKPQLLLRGLAAEVLGERGREGLSEDLRLRRAQLAEVVRDVIVRGSPETDTVICVEDLQWADVATLLAINNLLDVRRPELVVICTARSEEAIDPDARHLISKIEQKSNNVTLQGFSQGETREFIRLAMHPVRVKENEVRAVREFTAGNPLYLQELVTHLKASGVLERHTMAEALNRSRIPTRLAQLVSLRLRALPAPVRSALSVASVIGTEFSAELIAELLDEPQTAVEDDLTSATGDGVLRRLDRLDNAYFGFANPLYLANIYDATPPAERRAIHRQLAERARDGLLQLSINEMARHHALGFGAGKEAVEMCRQAAEEAEGLLGFDEAAHYWELALGCTRSRSRSLRAELSQRQGWALWAAGKWTRAAEAWKNAFAHYESQDDREHMAELALALGDLYRWRQELDEAERWLEAALAFPLQEPQARARGLALLGSIQHRRGEARGLDLLQEASELQHKHGRVPNVSYWLAWGFLAGGDADKGMAETKEAYADAKQRGDAGAAGLFARTLVDRELCGLRFQKAREYGRTVAEAIDPADGTTMIRSLVCDAHILSYRGRWRHVRRLCERWVAQVRLAGAYQLASARVVLAEAHLALGDTATGCEEMGIAHDDLNQPAGVALHLARALLQAGSVEGASALVERHAEQLINRPGRSTSAILGDVAAQLEMPDLWTACYELLMEERLPLVVYHVPISTARVLGRLAARMQEWTAAFEHFDTALKQLSGGGARWEHAQTLLNYAEARRARRRRADAGKADALELEAEAVYQGLGIPFETPSHEAGANRFGLTGRELEVLELMAQGSRNHEIAEALTISQGTAARHVENIFNKFGVGNRVEAIMKAVETSLVGPLRNSQPGGRPPDSPETKDAEDVLSDTGS